MKNPIYKICKDVLKITDEHVQEIREDVRRQSEYISPLKLATQGKFNALGDYNTRVLDKLEELRAILKAGPQ